MPPTRDNGASLYRVWLVDLFLSACRSGIGNQAAFNNALRAKENHDLNVYKLPETMFPSGTMYFSPAFADRRASAVVVHNNFIVGHHAKRQRFVDYGLWYLPTDAINPLRSLRVHPEGGGLHGTTALPQARYTAHVAAEQRSKELPRAGSIRHPEEELVTLTVLLRGSWRFVAVRCSMCRVSVCHLASHLGTSPLQLSDWQFRHALHICDVSSFLCATVRRSSYN
jgi:hypothetical protein